MQRMIDETRARLKLRHELGCWTGYLGLFLGLLALIATTSEGTPFAPNERAWVIFGFMLGGYAVGWAVAPTLDRLVNPQ